MTTAEAKVKRGGRPKGVANLDKPRPACARCQGQLRRDGACYQCGASATEAWQAPEGYQPPVTDEEVKQRSPARKGRLTDEQVWELRRRWRNSDLPLYRFAKEVAEEKSLPTGKDGLIAALRGWKAYRGV